MKPTTIKKTYELKDIGTVEMLLSGNGEPEEVLLTLTGEAGQIALTPEQVERLGAVVAQTRTESGDWRSVCAEHGYYTSNCEPCNEAKHVPPPLHKETLRDLGSGASGSGLTTTTEAT